MEIAVDPRSSFNGADPKRKLGFGGKSKIFMWVLRADLGFFMRVLKVDLAFFMWILVVDQGPAGTTAPKAMYVGSPLSVNHIRLRVEGYKVANVDDILTLLGFRFLGCSLVIHFPSSMDSLSNK